MAWRSTRLQGGSRSSGGGVVALYHFVTEFSGPAPPDQVWAIVDDPTGWPAWWRWLKRVIELGGADRLGARYRFDFRTALLCTLSFETEAVRTDPGSLVEVRSTGDLPDPGLWEIAGTGDASRLSYSWIVSTVRPGEEGFGRLPGR